MKEVEATFVTREFNKNSSEITREEFINMFLEDIENAKVAYRKWSDEIAEARYQKDNEEYAIKRAEKIEKIIADSYKLYKREFYRLRWVEKEIAKLPEGLIAKGYQHEGHDLGYISWDIQPWVNGSHLIRISDDMTHIANSLYNESIKNKYFLRCSGWSIVESFSTKFKLHLSADMQEQWEEDRGKKTNTNLLIALRDFMRIVDIVEINSPQIKKKIIIIF